MEARIVHRQSFLFVGLEIQTTAKTLQADIAALWERAALIDLDNLVRRRVDQNLSLAFIRNWNDTEPFSYSLGAEVEGADHIHADCMVETVCEATYAVFDMPGKGTQLVEPWPEIAKWFDCSEHEWVLPMNFREYDQRTEGGRIFIPISVP